MKAIKTSITLLALVLSITFQSCKSDDDTTDAPDDGPQTSCTTIANQTAQGNFRGEDFVSPEAFYKVFNAGGDPIYDATIFVKENTTTDCAFPTFEGNDDSIRFSIPSLEPQTVTFSDVAGQGDETLNFNRINSMGDTEIELAECGTLEIISYDDTTKEITGKLYAKGQEGSIVDGSFVLELCEL